VAFSADGEAFFIASGDDVIRWTTRSVRRTGKFPQGDRVRLIALSPDGKTLATATEGPVPALQFSDAATGKPSGHRLQFSDRVNAVAFHPTGNWIATAGADRTARVWKLPGLTQDGATLNQHGGEVLSIAFDPKGDWLLTGSKDSAAYVWEWRTGKRVGQPLAHRGEVTAVAFDKTGATAITGSPGAIRRWTLARDGAAPPGVDFAAPQVIAKTLAQPGREVTAGAFAIGAGYCALATASNSLAGLARVWHSAHEGTLGKQVDDSDPISAIALSPDGRLMAIAVDNAVKPAVRVTSTATGERAAPYLRHNNRRVLALAFSNDGKLVVSGGEDGAARLWETATGVEASFSPFVYDRGDAVLAVALSADNKAIVTGTRNGVVCRWDVDTGRRWAARSRHDGKVLAVSFSLDGTIIATGSSDQTARLWSAATGEPVGPTLEHGSAVTAIALSPEGNAILTGCEDGSGRLWDVATRKIVVDLPKAAGRIVAVGFQVQINAIATLAADRVVRLLPRCSAIGDDPKSIELRAKVHTGMELDENDQPRKLSRQERQKLADQLESLSTGTRCWPIEINRTPEKGAVRK
jgi:WD40 repeat protein